MSLSEKALKGKSCRRHGEGLPSRKGKGATICQGTEASGWPQESLEAAGGMQTGLGPGKGPSVCPRLLPLHHDSRDKGTTLSHLTLPSPAGSARWQGHQGVSIHYPLPAPKSSGAECWGGGCSTLCCHSNHPNPQPQSIQKDSSRPPPLGETWVCLGIFP